MITAEEARNRYIFKDDNKSDPEYKWMMGEILRGIETTCPYDTSYTINGIRKINSKAMNRIKNELRKRGFYIIVLDSLDSIFKCNIYLSWEIDKKEEN